MFAQVMFGDMVLFSDPLLFLGWVWKTQGKKSIGGKAARR